MKFLWEYFFPPTMNINVGVHKEERVEQYEDIRTILKMYTKLLNPDILSFVFCIFSNIYYSSLHISMKNKTMVEL